MTIAACKQGSDRPSVTGNRRGPRGRVTNRDSVGPLTDSVLCRSGIAESPIEQH